MALKRVTVATHWGYQWPKYSKQTQKFLEPPSYRGDLRCSDTFSLILYICCKKYVSMITPWLDHLFYYGGYCVDWAKRRFLCQNFRNILSFHHLWQKVSFLLNRHSILHSETTSPSILYSFFPSVEYEDLRQCNSASSGVTPRGHQVRVH